MLQERKCGEKAELTNEEKAYLEKELNGQYTIHKQIGRTGARSATFALTDKDGTQCVLKIPARPQDRHWIDNQTKGEAVKTIATEGYTGRVFIPHPIIIGSNYIVEPYAGIELQDDVYDALPEAEKNKIAYDLAEFLNFMHQKEPRPEIAPLGIFREFPDMPLSQVETFFHSAQTPTEQQEWAHTIADFKNRDTSDEITTLTHGDFRGQNILYNPQTKKVSVIDFELARANNVYRDFVPTASFCTSYNLLFRLIHHYNQMPREFPIHINPHKVMLMHRASYFHEYARCAIYRKITPQRQKDNMDKTTKAILTAFSERTRS